jgi:H+-transporting ATPase
MSNVEKEPGPTGTSPAQSTENVEPEKKKREYKEFTHDKEGPSSKFS